MIGISNPSLTGYGGISETIAGVGILLFACVLWYYRQRVQERQRIEWRVKDEPHPRSTDPHIETRNRRIGNREFRTYLNSPQPKIRGVTTP